jgi:hypothetical protein
MTTITNIAQLNAAIVAADGVTAPGTTVTITLGSNISRGATPTGLFDDEAGRQQEHDASRESRRGNADDCHERKRLGVACA